MRTVTFPRPAWSEDRRTLFIDKESDQTSPQKPPFGVAGWTNDDGAVLLNDKYDVWAVASDGSKAERRPGRSRIGKRGFGVR